MPQPTQFPSRDAELLQWLQHLVSGLTPAPTTYAITAAQLATLTSLVATFSTALAACEPSVRNKGAIVAKDAAREAVKANCRLIINAINSSATVTDAQKVALGLTVRATPQPRPIPPFAPLVSIDGVNGYLFDLSVSDSQTLGKRGKPKDCAFSTLFSFVGELPPSDVSKWKFEGTSTRVSFQVEIDAGVAPGSTVHFTAFWSNARGQSGPAMSPPVKAYVQFGAMKNAA